MNISVNYDKRKNTNLFSKFQTNKHINLEKVQNYIPIYDRFFSLNTTNYNSINLNHMWVISDIKDIKNKDNDNEHIFNCKLKNINNDDDFTINKTVFIKMAPLLDPFKYLVGKYNYNDPSLFNLPSIDKTCVVHPKIADPNNSSFIDGFFSFLSSKLLHSHNFIHGLDYYGSFLAIKKDFKINIMDDIDYLILSDFFNKQKNVLFNVEDYSHLINNKCNIPLKPLNISTSLKSNISLSAKSVDDSIFENIFENNIISLSDIKSKNLDINLVDITNSNEFIFSDENKSNSLKSGSSCSSRTSHTNEDDISETNSDNSNNLTDYVSDENICNDENNSINEYL